MNKRNVRMMSYVFGGALLASLAAYPLGYRTAQAEHYEHNPRIHAAIDALRDAQQELQEAPHDFHGKKAEAMDAIHNAELKLEEIKDW